MTDSGLLISTARRHPDAAVQLLLMVDGQARIDDGWALDLAPEVELHLAGLPSGLDRRQPPAALAASLAASLVEPVTAALQLQLQPRPFAIFGHGACAPVAVALAVALAPARPPMHVMVSASPPPLEPEPPLEPAAGPGPAAGAPAPAEPPPGLAGLAAPLTAFAGRHDPAASPARMCGWRPFTGGPFTLRVLEHGGGGDGDDFLRACRSMVVLGIKEELGVWPGGPPGTSTTLP